MQKFSTISPQSLSESNVDIWHIPLTHDLSSQINILNYQEQQRAQRFQFAHHQRRFIAAHVILRKIIAKYLDTAAHKLDFCENEYGKPQVISNIPIQFNLSHSKDLALLAIGYKHEIGIDLEYFSARPYLGIANNMFSEEEIAQISTLAPKLIPLSFFTIWSQKEAFIKACGQGLSYPTKSFSVPHLPHKFENVQGLNIKTFMPEINCCAAICYAPQVQSINQYANFDLSI